MSAPLNPQQLAPAPFCRRARPMLGTLVDISATGRTAEIAVTRAFEAVARVHSLMSYHDPASDLSRINRSPVRTPVQVHPWTWQVIAAAMGFSAASRGLFDISVAPALTRLGYLPRHDTFPRCSGQGDWRHIQLLPDYQVQLERCLRLDLGGIAKGFAVDRAVAALETAGVEQGSVNAGGDLRRFGNDWVPFAVRHPAQAARIYIACQARRLAMATSSGYGVAKRHGGVLVSPHIHPRTRRALPPMRSVSIVAPDALAADALTKIVLLDPPAGRMLLPRYGAHALLLELDAHRSEWDIIFNTIPATV